MPKLKFKVKLDIKILGFFFVVFVLPFSVDSFVVDSLNPDFGGNLVIVTWRD